MPEGHWQEYEPASLLQIAPGGQGFTAHSSMSEQPPFIEGLPVYPLLHRHVAMSFNNMQWAFGPQETSSQGSE